MYLVSCERHSMEIYIHESYPWAQGVLARRYMEVTSWRPGAVDCTVWNEHHTTRLACRRPGPGAHRDIERGKVPSAARVACIARSACTSLDQNLVRGLPLRVGERPMRHVRWGTCLQLWWLRCSPTAAARERSGEHGIVHNMMKQAQRQSV